MSALDHACDTCGGTGTGAKCYCEAERAKYGWPRAHHYSECPVCLGSGRISDRMPDKDSTADLATFWAVVNEMRAERTALRGE